ncbi:MAG: AAA family ATPase, partial [Bacteroidales bacterium]|nr:AAA family ATPase [Bacteroidales bacterium]
MYIKRHIDKELIAWKKAQKHKPLLLRGARQVGKSSSVRELGKTFKNFVEINFEKKEFDLVKDVFIRHSSPNLICNELSAMLGQKIVAGETLLFLDEVQSCIPAIEALRYFYEEMPDLHVIAAGSLLEFALEQVPTFGVGRVRSLFMYPLSFDEFIRAMNFNTLADAVLQAKDKMDFPISLHQKCIEHLKIFL